MYRTSGDGSAKLGTVRKWLIVIGLVGVAAVVVVGLTQAGDDAPSPQTTTTFTRAEVTAPLAGQPPKLAALHAALGRARRRRTSRGSTAS